jgi:hypothetical protein
MNLKVTISLYMCVATDISFLLMWLCIIHFPVSASELYRSSDRHLSANLVPTLADRGYHVVSETDPYDSIIGFLDRSRYFLFQVAPQLYSRG